MGNMETAVCMKAVAQVLRVSGFGGAEKEAFDLLVETYTLYMHDLFSRTKAYTEFGLRTQPTLNDVLLGMADMGISLPGLDEYLAYCESRGGQSDIRIPTPTRSEPAELIPISYESDNFTYIETAASATTAACPQHLPPFPNPHTYIHNELTVESKDPSQLRARAAAESRQVEMNLTRFLSDAAGRRKNAHNLHFPQQQQCVTNAKAPKSVTIALPAEQQQKLRDQAPDQTLPVNYESGWRRKRRRIRS
ncbi:uncharacterized protein EV422DRAFT_513233, partial [Fimicolochytrium jonesii]|uniref:uncharacterized protein n=1 Tax=Fimicolochytrium jonesii TaxID=1396493 RepID=UPI0022FE6E8A